MNSFPEEVKNNAKLYVPEGSFSAYWSAKEWEDFKIEEKLFNPITSISIEDFELTKDSRIRIPYKIEPIDASIIGLKFSCSDDNIAEVTEDGFITGKMAGETFITIASQDGSNIIKECRVTVKEPTITKFEISPKSLVLIINQEAAINIEIEPENTNKTVEWESADTNISVVKSAEEGAIVLGRSIGETDIIVRSVEFPEVFSTCHVSVVDDPTLYGDVNQDGIIDERDLVQLIEILLDKTSATPEADSNRDGNVNGLDYIHLTKMINQ